MPSIQCNAYSSGLYILKYELFDICLIGMEFTHIFETFFAKNSKSSYFADFHLDASIYIMYVAVVAFNS